MASENAAMIRSAWRALTMLGPLLGGVAPVGAMVELGPEVQVNTYTTGPQRQPSIAGRTDGSFVVTWESGTPYGYDAPGDSASGVFLQRFDAAGMPVGGEQHVNTFTIADQHRPVVNAGAGATFVVVWESGCPYYGGPDCTQDGSRGAVALQRFDAVGTPVGGELLVNTQTIGHQSAAAVASLPTGEFVVAWTSRELGYPAPLDVVARRFTAGGQPAGDEFSVDGSTTGYDSAPAVAVDSSGNFIVVWVRSEPEGGPFAIHGRGFDAAGTPLGEFVVAGATTAYGTFGTSVASVGQGEFVVAWEAYYYSYYSLAEQPKQGEVRARHVSIDGTLGPVFAANSYVPGHQILPQVASDAAGNFVIAWTSDSYQIGHGQDGDDSGIFAQVFAREGTPLGSEFQVNAFTTANQYGPAVAASGLGEFVVVWTSHAPAYVAGSPAQDGSGPGVFRRTVALPTCDAPADCDDANPCTTDACEGGVCLNRRQPGCCQTSAECFDGQACTEDVCTGTTCSNPAIIPCEPCARSLPYCQSPDVCMTGTCDFDLGRCEFSPKPGCCYAAAECDDGLACTTDACTNLHACTHEAVPDCIDCTGDAECSTGCLIAPEICTDGRCESPPGCPVVAIEDRSPLGSAGKLLASVRVPETLPGKGKVKAVITGRIGAREASDAPSRRCRTGKAVGSGRIVLAPGTEANALLALGKVGARCLADDPDGFLPVDVTVRVIRKKTPLSEVTASRTWRQ